jgi:hypothetical protein
MKSLMGILVLYFIVFVIGCSKDKNPVGSDLIEIDEIMPLEVGNKWIYIDSTFSTNDSLISVDTIQLCITGKSTILFNAESLDVYYWIWNDKYKNIPEDYKWLVRNESDGLCFYGLKYLDSSSVLGRSLMYKYPVTTGEEWEADLYSFNLDGEGNFLGFSNPFGIFMNCYSTNERYKTALGEMDCIVYYYQFFPRPGNYEYYYYFKKNLGYVGYIVKFRGVVIRKRILRSYELFTTPKKRQ